MMSSALGQCFQLAFQLFLQINGIPPPSDTEAVQELAEVYHDDLVHYSKVSIKTTHTCHFFDPDNLS